MEIQTIGIVGAGQMGNGIAHVMALAGYDVLLTDVSEEAMSAAMDTIEGNMKRQVGRGKISEEDQQAAFARIKTTPTRSTMRITTRTTRSSSPPEAPAARSSPRTVRATTPG